MGSRRTTARGALLLLATSLIAGSAAARPDKPPAQIIFPVVGPVEYSDDFGELRGQGPHEGIDILAPKRALAVAAEAGTVTFWTTSPAGGCLLYLYGDSGTTYLYVHLNNDLTKRNDNRGKCVAGTAYAPGLEDGTQVEAGEPVGYVGDSGDANGLHPHLHFELHPGDGRAVDPYRFLNAAQRLLFSVPLGTTFTLALSGSVVSAPPGTLELKVDLLRAWPTHLRVAKLGRRLVVSVPPSAVIEGSGPSGGADLLAGARKGQPVNVWTAPAPATLEAQLGVAGALSAARVALLP